MSTHIRTLRSKKLHPEHVKLINEAIRHNARGKEKDVHITYRKENGEVSERKVRPLAVKGKSLFVAHCHERNAIRSFRVERIGMVKSAFWDGFEKRAVSVAWIKRMNDRGLVSRALKVPDESGVFGGFGGIRSLTREGYRPTSEVMLENIEKNYKKGLGRSSNDRMHWSMSPDRKSIRSAIKSLNRETKREPERAVSKALYAEKHPGYLHGLGSDTHAPWKHNKEWADKDRKVKEYVLHGSPEKKTK